MVDSIDVDKSVEAAKKLLEEKQVSPAFPTYIMGIGPLNIYRPRILIKGVIQRKHTLGITRSPF